MRLMFFFRVPWSKFRKHASTPRYLDLSPKAYNVYSRSYKKSRIAADMP